MPLNEMKVRNAKPKAKPYKISDSDGLYLFVTEKGGKLWRFKYRFDKKEKLLAFCTYPEISLYDARQRRDEARKQIANKIDPSAVRKAQKQSSIQETETFERALKLEGDDKHIDIRTLKQRGVRAVKRGKQKILQQRKTTS